MTTESRNRWGRRAVTILLAIFLLMAGILPSGLTRGNYFSRTVQAGTMSDSDGHQAMFTSTGSGSFLQGGTVQSSIAKSSIAKNSTSKKVTAKSSTTKSSTTAKKSTAKSTSSSKSSTEKTGSSSKSSRKISKAAVSSTKTKSSDQGKIEITMLDVGQGLSILIKADDEYMLFDGGGREHSSYVVGYLKSHKITKLKYMVASHYDEDHIAGLVGVLNTVTVSTAITPDYKADTKIYDSFITMLKKNGAKVKHPSRGDTFSIGKAKFQVVSPKKYDAEDDNNSSIAIRITLGSFSCLITGDAEEEAEETMVSSGYELESTLYVVGHHGSSSSTSESFLKEVDPEYAFISVGEDNSYGHPTKQTLNRLKKAGVKMFRSDEQGEVTCTSNGKTYSFSEKPSNDWTSGGVSAKKSTGKKSSASRSSSSKSSGNSGKASAKSSGNSGKKSSKSSGNSGKASTKSSGSSGYKYILNANTKKFHYPSCHSVDQMADHNKVYSGKSREELIKEGYSPCGNCNP